MTPKKKPSRPKSVIVDTVRIRASRGPRPDGSWYWRADRGGRRNRVHVWCGWSTPETVGQKVMAHLLSRGERPKRNDVQVRTIHDLLATWTEAGAAAGMWRFDAGWLHPVVGEKLDEMTPEPDASVLADIERFENELDDEKVAEAVRESGVPVSATDASLANLDAAEPADLRAYRDALKARAG